MVTATRLTVQTGPHKGKKFCFCGATTCQIGRAPDCFIQMFGTDRDQLISRHHCELAIAPSSIRIQDLGSRNGTYVNGRRIEATTKWGLMEGAKANENECQNRLVQSGDLLTVGGTTFQIEIVECPPKEMVDSQPIIWKEGETAKKGCPIGC